MGGPGSGRRKAPGEETTPRVRRPYTRTRHALKLTVSHDGRALLEEGAARRGLSVSAYVEELAREAAASVALTAEDRARIEAARAILGTDGIRAACRALDGGQS